METLLFVPRIDIRYGQGKIASRIGIQSDAYSFCAEDDLFVCASQQLKRNANIKCVLVDEANFLTKAHVQQLCKICDELNIPVLAYGLRSDFQGEPFPGSLYLLVWADILIEIKTICHCGKKATMNIRIDSEGNAVTEGEQIEVGGNERYLSVCRKHFLLGDPGPLPLTTQQSLELSEG